MPYAAAALLFTSSVGIDTHIDMIGSSYQNYAQMVNALSYVGVSNVRDTYDNLNDAAEYNQMAQLLSLKFDFFIALGSAGVPWQLAQIAANPGIVSYVEGYNESDAWWQTYQGKTGIAATQAVQQALYAAVKANPQLANVGVIQSSFARLSTFPSYGNMSAYADYGNTHSYFGTGNNPAGGNWANYLVSLAATVTPGKPTITTEAGWFTMPGNVNGVSEAVQAKYELTLLLEQAKAGVKLTYLWELADNYADPGNTDPEDHFGVFHADWTPKAAAVALHNLMQIMADPGTGTVPPGSLDYTLTGMPATAQSALYEKSDGTFMLALWNDVRLSGPLTQADIAVAPVPVTLTLTRPFTQVSIFDPLTGATSIQSFANATTIQLAVPDHPVIVSLSQVAIPASTRPAVVAPNQVLTTPGALVHVQGLSIGNLGPTAPVSLRLTAGSNSLSLQDLAGHVLASGASAVTLTGNVATVNAELATLGYRGGSLGSDAITVALTAGGAGTVTTSVAVAVVVGDQAVVSGGPVLSLPSSFTLTAGSTAALPALTMADPYAATHAGTVSLTVTDQKGRLAVPGGAGTVTGNGTAALAVAGTYAQVVAALAGLTYTADAAAGSDVVTISLKDQAGRSSSGQIGITAGAAPILSGPSILQARPGQAVQLGNAVLTDTLAAGGANLVTVTVTAGHGVLSAPASSGFAGSGTASITVGGTVAAVNAALAALSYTADANSPGDVVTVLATDLYGGRAALPIAIPSVQIAGPSLSPTDPVQVSATATAPIPSLVIADPAAATGAQVTVSLSSKLGTLGTSMASGVSITATAGGLRLSGTLAAVNAALGYVHYAAGSATGTDLVSVSVTDTAGGVAASQLKVDVVPPPKLVLPSIGPVKVGATVSLGALQVVDASAGSRGTFVTVRLTATLGSLFVNGTVPAVAGNTHILLVSGTLHQVNAALATLSYKAGATAATDHLKVSVSDAYGGSALQTMTLTGVAWDTNGISPVKWNTMVDAGAEMTFLNELQPSEVFHLNAAGQGVSIISGFTTDNGDTLDLTQALAGMTLAPDLSDVSKVLTASASNGDTTLSLTPVDGTSDVIAILRGVTTSVVDLLSHHSLVRS